MDGRDIKEMVKEKYGQAALSGKSCCGTADSTGSACDPITSNLYDATEMQQVPGAALEASHQGARPAGEAVQVGTEKVTPDASRTDTAPAVQYSTRRASGEMEGLMGVTSPTGTSLCASASRSVKRGTAAEGS